MAAHRFIGWTQTASTARRVEAAGALVARWAERDIAADERATLAAAMAGLLDDPVLDVRAALAEALADRTDAPRSVVVALANDCAAVAAPILARSSLLQSADLIACLALGETESQIAIARRARLSQGVLHVLADTSSVAAARLLAERQDVTLDAGTLVRLAARHPEDALLRDRLLERADLPTTLRLDLVAATARALTVFVTDCAWLSPERARRVSLDASEAAALELTGQAAMQAETLRGLAAHLRARGALTANLLLRALLHGQRGFFAAALAELAGLPAHRSAALAARPHAAPFAAMFRRAGLPDRLLPAFIAALDGAPSDHEGRCDRLRLARVIAVCDRGQDEVLAALAARLHRLDADAARREAAAHRQPIRLMPRPAMQIDLAAIEAELLAA